MRFSAPAIALFSSLLIIATAGASEPAAAAAPAASIAPECLNLLTDAVLPGPGKAAQQRQAKPAARETLTSDITLDPGARAASLESLSGAINLSRGSRVSGDVSSDYGALVLEPESEVAGRLSSHGGSIRIDGARVGRGIATTSGDIDIGPDSWIDGGILVRKRGVVGLSLGFFQLGIPAGRSTPPRVVIGPGATVRGQLRFKREVQLFVSERASIGPVEGATPIVFSGERPPGLSDTHLRPE